MNLKTFFKIRHRSSRSTASAEDVKPLTNDTKSGEQSGGKNQSTTTNHKVVENSKNHENKNPIVSQKTTGNTDFPHKADGVSKVTKKEISGGNPQRIIPENLPDDGIPVFSGLRSRGCREDFFTLARNA